MRFLFVSNFFENFNAGAAGSLLQIGKSLKGMGHEVDGIWRDPAPSFLKNQALHELLELPHIQLRQVKKQLEAKNYDMVSVSQPYGYLIFERLKSLYPKTVFINRTHGWEERVYELRKRWDTPATSLGAAFFSKCRESLTRNACARSVRSCHGLVAPGSKCAQYILSHHSIDPSCVATIPHGVDEKYFQVTPEKKNSTAARLLYVGNYLPIKGSKILETVLPEISRHPNHPFMTLVIPKESLSRAEKIYRPHWKQRLTLLPWMPHLDLADIYKEHDLFIFPSLFEAFGRTFLEAMACGLCVVGFNEGGLSDIAKHEESAFIHEPGDHIKMIENLHFLLSHPEKITEIGNRAKRIANEYTWRRSAALLEKFTLLLQEKKIKKS